MNRALWVIQALLAALFLYAGGIKFYLPIEEMAKQVQLSGTFLRFIGVCEVLGGVGLVVPWWTGKHRWLTPLAAAGLIVIMIGAVTVTAVYIGPKDAIFPAVAGVLLAFVVYGRTRSR